MPNQDKFPARLTHNIWGTLQHRLSPALEASSMKRLLSHSTKAKAYKQTFKQALSPCHQVCNPYKYGCQQLHSIFLYLFVPVLVTPAALMRWCIVEVIWCFVLCDPTLGVAQDVHSVGDLSALPLRACGHPTVPGFRFRAPRIRGGRHAHAAAVGLAGASCSVPPDEGHGCRPWFAFPPITRTKCTALWLVDYSAGRRGCARPHTTPCELLIRQRSLFCAQSLVGTPPLRPSSFNPLPPDGWA